MDQATSSTVDLGNNVFAYVKTWGGKVKIHIRTYGPSRFSSTTDRLVPTKRGVALDGKQFQKLLQCQKRLSIEHYEQTKKLEAITNHEKAEDDNREGRKEEEEDDASLIYDSQPPEDFTSAQKRKRYGLTRN